MNRFQLWRGTGGIQATLQPGVVVFILPVLYSGVILLQQPAEIVGSAVARSCGFVF